MIRSHHLLGGQQTPCDTIPVPQNLVVSRLLDTADKPITGGYPSSAQDDVARPLSSLASTMTLDHEMHDGTHAAAASASSTTMDSTAANEVDAHKSGIQNNRKLCVRHKRMADEGANVAMQQSLDALPVAEREAVNRIWSSFSSASHPSRCLILKGLLTMCCFSQLSLLSQELQNIIRIDPFTVFPAEISLRILSNLDAISLGRAAQVSRRWRRLADDNMLWKSICEQHIDKKCTKCGWGLALMKKPRTPAVSRAHSETPGLKRQRGDADSQVERPVAKRLKTESSTSSLSATPATSRESTPVPSTSSHTRTTPSPTELRTRPWKNVYCERLKLERNWRNGRCTVRTLKGHADGVMCLQFADNMTGIKFPILITGSYDHTVRVWNLTEGKEIRRIHGHTRAIRALQFDDAKLITGSMDGTLRIWNWRSGECVKELRGHSAGVVSLHFDEDVLVSGSVDTTVRVWNFRSKDSFVLRGHLDWVNSVVLWDDPSHIDHLHGPSSDPASLPAGKMLFSASDDGVVRLWDLATRHCVRSFTGHTGQIQTLKLLMIDRSKIEQARNRQRETIPQVSDGSGSSSPSNQSSNTSLPHSSTSHHAQSNNAPLAHPYSALPSGMPGFAPANVSVPSPPSADHPGFLSPQFLPPEGFDPTSYRRNPNSPPGDAAFSHSKPTHLTELPLDIEHSRPVPILISGALDNTIRVWDVETGRVLNTLFGHIEGVWAVAGDKFRVVSGSHDRTIKIWDRDNGNCQTTLVGHRGAVTCLSVGDDKIVSGSDDGDVKIWDFGFKE